ncbi:hypothetical protein OROGR_008732 [Orobanche gracilis]
MNLMSKKIYIHESEALSPPIKSPQTENLCSSSHTTTSFPITAVAIIGILATAFLLVSYYIFAIKCCLNWHRIDILSRFSFSRRRRADDPLVVYNSPVASAASRKRGLNEAAIRSIPIFKFKKPGNEQKNEAPTGTKSSECAVCLNEFQEEENLRVIPDCGHVFHIDCIDVWLQNNANCPLCRTSISSNTSGAQFHLDQIIFPTPSPQDPADNLTGRDEDYVVIEIESEHAHVNPSLSRIPEKSNSAELLTKITREKVKEFNHVSSMGDECIDSRQKDERFVVQPVRRSFSMDSGADRQLYLAVEEIIQKHSEGCSRVKRSFFSFGQGKGSSRSSVQPVALN